MAPAKRKPRKAKSNVSGKEVTHHWKAPGFNAFGAETRIKKRKTGGTKIAMCEKVEPPETGIHSLKWAQEITSQEDCGILKLPFEVRLKIWEYVIADLSFADKPITPKKKGNRFWSPNWPDAAKETECLYGLCRQIYVDLVGSGLLYKFKQFSFTPGLMLNYLWVINPVHRNAIRSINLVLYADSNFRPPPKPFRMLADLEGLQDLVLEINVFGVLCAERSRYRVYLPSGPTPQVLHNNRLVPSCVITKLRTCAPLRELRCIGLQSFKMLFTVNEYLYGEGHHILRKTILSGGDTGPYHELEAELQQALLGGDIREQELVIVDQAE